jgi:hypothetical protein
LPWTPEANPSSTWTAEENTDFSDADQWRMPTDKNEHLLATIAVEDLLVNPEDIEENPEDVQANRDDWTVES